LGIWRGSRGNLPGGSGWDGKHFHMIKRPFIAGRQKSSFLLKSGKEKEEGFSKRRGPGENLCFG